MYHHSRDASELSNFFRQQALLLAFVAANRNGREGINQENLRRFFQERQQQAEEVMLPRLIEEGA